MGAGAAVISGNDWRRNGPFINQEWLITNGGPATPETDGWLNYGLPVAAGLMYRGSVEVDESKYPILVKHLRVIPGGGGAGEQGLVDLVEDVGGIADQILLLGKLLGGHRLVADGPQRAGWLPPRP